MLFTQKSKELSEKGQGLVEYAIILVLVAIVVIACMIIFAVFSTTILAILAAIVYFFTHLGTIFGGAEVLVFLLV